MRIGWVSSPLEWEKWPEAEAMLIPAAARADEAIELLSDNALLWAVMDGDELLAVATARLCVNGDCEVMLVGGREHARWLNELDETIGAAARDAGATRLVASGRAGWAKSLKALGWASERVDRDTSLYARELGGTTAAVGVCDW